MILSLPVKLGIFVVALFAVVIAACLAWKPLKERLHENKLLSTQPEGQPLWFPLGGEVYHSEKRFEEQKKILEFRAEPRWFKAYPAYDGGPKEKGIRDGFLKFPAKIEDIPLLDQGAALRLTVNETDNNSILRFRLKLTAKERPLKRETEHRWTNILPVLFAFFADGKAVKKTQGQPGPNFQMGGNLGDEIIAEKGDYHEWDLKVASKCLDKILSGHDSSLLHVVAAFSERQHDDFDEEGWNIGDNIQWSKSAYKIPQALIRSNTIRLMKKNGSWLVLGDMK